jgi:hypothetical protein
MHVFHKLSHPYDRSLQEEILGQQEENLNHLAWKTIDFFKRSPVQTSGWIKKSIRVQDILIFL